MILLAFALAVLVLYLLDRMGAPIVVAALVALLFFIVALTYAPTDFDFGRGR